LTAEQKIVLTWDFHCCTQYDL